MISRYNLHITCACGRHVYLPAEDVPADWLDATGLNILPGVFDRMVCRACGRRGRPQHTNISAASWMRGMSTGTRETVPVIAPKDEPSA